MLIPRVMPCLLLQENALVKTVGFKKPHYVGDPINTIRIFNEKEVDELILLDITATTLGKPPAFEMVSQIVSECFMPLTYGGGIRNLVEAKQLLTMGVEKIAINSAALENPRLISELAEKYGSQSVVVSIDVKKNWLGKYKICSHGGKKVWQHSLVEYAKSLQNYGAGEVLLTAVDQEGSFSGYDLTIIQALASELDIPIIANGGAGCLEDLSKAIQAGASALALGSMVVYQGKNRAVLTNFPDREVLESYLVNKEC